MMNNSNWIVFQSGSREHYAIPRMFHKHGELQFLVTDIWFNPNSVFSKLFVKLIPQLSSRYSPEIDIKKVISANSYFLLVQLLLKFSFFKKRINYDALVIQYFEKQLHKLNPPQNSIVFSYNYVASALFEEAKRKGLKCILGQIDAGPLAGEINQNLFKQAYGDTIKPNPDLYKIFPGRWEKECELADKIIVNSPWSQQLILKTGVDKSKIEIIELAYEAVPYNTVRKYPVVFDKERPLKVLFLGSLKLLKGILPMLDCIRLMKDKPVQFYLVGSIQITQNKIAGLPDNCIITGPVSKEKAKEFYSYCDVLVLPTFSDGFAMTQLEAQSVKMPIVATNHCGKVVTDRVNGRIIEPINGENIAAILDEFLTNPSLLDKYSQSSINLESYNLESIYKKYSTLKF